MIFFFQPLLHKDDDKHGGHNKADAVSIKFKQSAGLSLIHIFPHFVEIMRVKNEGYDMSLISTLRQYILMNGNLSVTASALYIHRSSSIVDIRYSAVCLLIYNAEAVIDKFPFIRI